MWGVVTLEQPRHKRPFLQFHPLSPPPSVLTLGGIPFLSNSSYGDGNEERRDASACGPLAGVRCSLREVRALPPSLSISSWACSLYGAPESGGGSEHGWPPHDSSFGWSPAFLSAPSGRHVAIFFSLVHK